MLLFGLAAYPLHGAARALAPRLLALLSALGLILSGAAFLLLTAQMAGTSIADLDRETLRFVVLETQTGTAFLLRVAALLLAGLLAFAMPTQRWLIAALTGAALATLAWTGHAAATEGLAGTVHRFADAVHLLAAAAWLGALAMLLKTLLAPLADDAAIADARRALASFAIAGSVLVALVVITGLVNAGMIVGLAGLPLLPATPYGQLLIAKLALFSLMLGCAAANRWRLTPALAGGDPARAVRALRRSIAIEAGAGVVILALVAWLGTLPPPAAL